MATLNDSLNDTDTSSNTDTSNEKPIATSINIRSTSLVILTVVTLIVFLEWSQSVFAPIVLGMLLSYALYPIVSFLNRFWIPHWLGAAVVVGSLMAATYFAAGSLQEQTLVLLDKVPEAAQKFARVSDANSDEPSVMEKLRTAAAAVENATATDEPAAKPKVEPGVTRVAVEDNSLHLEEYLWGGSVSIILILGQFASVLLLVYFILASGRLYKQKIVKVTGDSLSEKKITITILEDINRQLRLFFFVMLFGAVFVGVATWLAFWWLGVEEAALWGALAGVASMIPYLGPAVIFIATGFVAFMQFGTAGMALGVAAVSLIITSLQGNFITPLMTSRASSMNAVGIFISLLFWGWLWGPVGLIVATPIQLVIKSVCDHVENLQTVGEFLGD